MAPRALVLATLLAPSLVACSFLVRFEDHEPTEETDPEAGTPAPTPTPVPATPRDSGAAPDVATTFSCAGKNGVAVPGTTDRACCDGVDTLLTSQSHCGGCNMACQSSQQCTLEANGRYYCSGCGSTGGRPSCWSNCCSGVYGAKGVCAPNDCDSVNCVDINCSSRGMKCVNGTMSQASYCTF